MQTTRISLECLVAIKKSAEALCGIELDRDYGVALHNIPEGGGITVKGTARFPMRLDNDLNENTVINWVMNIFLLKDKGDIQVHTSRPDRPPVLKSIVDTLKDRRLYPFFAGYMLSTTAWVFMNWMPQFLIDVRGMTYIEVGQIASLGTIAGIPGCILVSAVSDRLKKRKAPLLGFSILATTLLIVFLNLPSSTPIYVFSALNFLMGFAYSYWVLYFSMIPETLPPQKAAVGLGLVNGLGTIGFSIFTPIYGYFIDVTGTYTISNNLIQVLCDEGDEVILPVPYWVSYAEQVKISEGTNVILDTGIENDFKVTPEQVKNAITPKTRAIMLCSPSNPTGWVAGADYYTRLLELADKHDFYVLADECYSEIFWETPPVGLLEVAQSLGREGFSRCLVFNSLSKRSALPGLRSGLIAGDAELIGRFAKLRSYTGPATPIPLQQVAAAAWSDETHVQRHLEVYRQSLALFFDTYGRGSPPAGSFFVWLPVEDEEAFAVAAYEQQAVTILPGSYLGATDRNGNNSGTGYVRAALVDGPEKAAELAERLKAVRV